MISQLFLNLSKFRSSFNIVIGILPILSIYTFIRIRISCPGTLFRVKTECYTHLNLWGECNIAISDVRQKLKFLKKILILKHRINLTNPPVGNKKSSPNIASLAMNRTYIVKWEIQLTEYLIRGRRSNSFS